MINNVLRQFFRTGPRSVEGEPSLRELEREIDSVLHKHADGKIVIENESPHLVGGKHKVVADVQKRGKRGAKIEVEE